MATDASQDHAAAHTAGIFATKVLDGPEIGTLVAIVDRARNLPNRKTMGKQDPYCAMRLGKEAKKTGTDRRGGQTPKWDQELRFIVHDSADYYRLKCSVFNDDKKTDMIGEAWIDLKELVVPGGGKNDLWHQLSFKGKYAGDIRMELTYYDARLKREANPEKSRDQERSSKSKARVDGEDAVVPRKLGPREVRRRPLPVEPTQSSSAERMSQQQTQPILFPQSSREGDGQWREDGDDWDTEPSFHEPHTGDFHDYHEMQNESYDQQMNLHDFDPNSAFREQSQPGYVDNGFTDEPTEHRQFDRASFQSDRSSYAPSFRAQQQSAYEGEHRRSLPLPDAAHGRPLPQFQSTPYNSSPPSMSHDTRGAVSAAESPVHHSFRRYSTSPTKTDVFRDSPLRQSISRHDLDAEFPSAYDAQDDQGAPPPPPAHRVGVAHPTSRTDEQSDMPPVAVPRPLNLGSRSPRVSPFDRSPLQTIERNYNPEQHTGSPTSHSPVTSSSQYLPYRKPTYVEPEQQVRSNSYDRPRSGIENTPPSLMTGQRSSGKYDDWQLDQGRQPTRRSTGYSASPGSQSGFLPHHQHQNSQGEDYRTPASRERDFRPQSSPAEDEPQMTKPFGPDSYNVFNSSSSIGSSVTSTEIRYDTPEHSREASRQLGQQRSQELIIGNDGRVIDPTDHLPSDTWAPEPERKPRRPEVVIRYQVNPNTQTPPKLTSSPASARPHSFTGPSGSSPMTGDSPLGFTSRSGGRNRLQKQATARPLPTQPYPQAHSSPAVPQTNYNTPPPRPMHRAETDLSSYARYSPQGYSGSLRGSPSTFGGPPIPDKIQISPTKSSHRNDGSGGMDALSAELSQIDIGAGSNGRGSRTRRVYG